MRYVLSSPARGLLLVALLACTSGRPAAAQSFSYDGSVRYSQGKYTLDRTVTSAFWLNRLSYSSSGWWAELMVPVIYQDSADVRYVGGMPMPGGGHDGDGGGHHGGGGGHHGGGGGGDMPGGRHHGEEDFDELGLADPYLSLGAVLYRDVFDRSSLGAFLSVKPPVADANQGFGSGEWDLGVGVSWLRRTRRNLFFAELAYWSLGDPPEVSLANAVAFELAYGRALGDSRFLVESAVWGRTETVEGVDGPIALDLTLSRSLKRQHSVYVTAEAGFTESAPDFALVVGYRYRRLGRASRPWR